MQAGALVNKAIDDLLEPSVNLKDALLKVKAIAVLIGNEELKLLVKNELEGYDHEAAVPSYRRFSVMTRANLLTTYGEQSQLDVLIGVEYLENSLCEALMYCTLRQSVSELDNLTRQTEGGYLQMPVTKSMQRMIQNALYSKSDWHIHSCWRVLSIASVEAVLSTVRSKLLDILLELKVTFGDDLPLQSLQQKQMVNDTVDKTMHSINVTNGTVNISNGNSSVQATNNGQGAINAATGSGISQTISGEQKSSVQDLISQIEKIIADETIFNNQREEMEEELKRVDVQLKREEPKKGIIKRSFESLKDLAADAAGTTAGHAVFELIKQGLELSQ
jgi:hypothetical protein